MPNKTSRRMVALSASAIATIYAAGFMLTRSADANLASPSTTVTVTAAAPGVPTATSGGQTAVVGASAATSAAGTSTLGSTYADGTYSGQGTSRRGGVSVAVKIQSGTIANVQITSVSTEYPVSRIASLPGLVVKQQTANVNTISGATYSSLAFKQAVQQALSLAQAASTTTAA